MTEPSRGISKVAEYPDSIFYRATCSCLDNRHDQTLILDVDREDGLIHLSIHSDIWTKYNYVWCPDYDDEENDWRNKLRYYRCKLKYWYRSEKNKWKQVFTLIFTSQIEGENEFLFNGEEQIQSYIDALQSGLDKIKERNIHR